MSERRTPTVELLKVFLEAFNQHDLDAIMAFFADDCSMDSPRGPDPWGARFTGPEQVRAGCACRFAGLPNAHYGEDRHRYWVSGY